MSAPTWASHTRTLYNGWHRSIRQFQSIPLSPERGPPVPSCVIDLARHFSAGIDTLRLRTGAFTTHAGVDFLSELVEAVSGFDNYKHHLRACAATARPPQGGVVAASLATFAVRRDEPTR